MPGPVLELLRWCVRPPPGTEGVPKRRASRASTRSKGEALCTRGRKHKNGAPMKEPEYVGGSKQEREETSWKMPWTTSKCNWPFDAHGQVCPAGALMLRTWSRRGSWPFPKASLSCLGMVVNACKAPCGLEYARRLEKPDLRQCRPACRPIFYGPFSGLVLADTTLAGRLTESC